MAAMRAKPAPRSGTLLGCLVLACAMLAVAAARPRLVARFRDVKTATDLYALPPPSVLPALSLGYRSAAADLVFTTTVVSYGIHGEERRRFEFVGDYLDAIIALDPDFCQTYRYADTFIVYQPVGSPAPDDVRHARRVLEKGLSHCPADAILWVSSGQFMAFIATQFLTNEEEKSEYRAAGAKVLARAGQLVGRDRDKNLVWQSLAAAGIFTREGNREAAISFLEKAYAVTDDAELREGIAQRLMALQEEGAVERGRRHAEAFSRVWQSDFRFVSRTQLLVLGPPWDPADCAGETVGLRDDMLTDDGEVIPALECTKRWADWGRR
jgi:tetratricopeptide (TPR) repeat protein